MNWQIRQCVLSNCNSAVSNHPKTEKQLTILNCHSKRNHISLTALLREADMAKLKISNLLGDFHALAITIFTPVKMWFKEFFQIVKALQGCPWIQNKEERSLLQSQLKACCNASYSMIVTQENSPVGNTISYDAEEKTLNITENFYSLFPKKSRFLKPLGNCAVVGNSGILNGSFCGAKIDNADFVFRMNLPPLNQTKDVGTKTDLVTANPSIIIDKYGSLRERRKPFINKIKEYGSSLLLLPAFSYSFCTDVSLRILYTLEDFDLNSRVVFFNPDYIKRLDSHWKSKGLQSYRMSSGLMLVSVAVEVCEMVTLYGFWPFSEDLNEVPVSHHYYDNVPPNPGMHFMPDEFYQYLQMHIQGSLFLNLAQC
ncbi:alpha-2,8-sialyltransferase 8F-like [Gastrophryne carolinensis]